MRKQTIWLAAAGLLAAASAAEAGDCTASSSVTTGPDGTVVQGTPGRTVTVYDKDGRPVGVMTTTEGCDGAAAGSSASTGSTTSSGGSAAVGASAGAGSTSGSTTSGPGGLSSSVTVGPGGVSGDTSIK